jgi:hypothetical protein
MNNIKVGFVLTCHQSQKIRPNGFYIVDRFIQSIHNHCHYDHAIYLFDNSSEDKFDLERYKGYNLNYTYVEDQTLRGNTGPWNDGVIKAIEDGVDQVFICNDDLILNKSINNFITEISRHQHCDKGIFGPLCQPTGVLGGPQGRHAPDFKIVDVTGKGKFGDPNPTGGYILNGFLFGFTKEFYQTYKYNNGEIFDPTIIWGGNESELQFRLWEKGARSIIIGSCWIYHEKIRAWKVHMNPDGNQANMTVEERLNHSEIKLKDYEENWKPLMEKFNE